MWAFLATAAPQCRRDGVGVQLGRGHAIPNPRRIMSQDDAPECLLQKGAVSFWHACGFTNVAPQHAIVIRNIVGRLLPCLVHLEQHRPGIQLLAAACLLPTSFARVALGCVPGVRQTRSPQVRREQPCMHHLVDGHRRLALLIRLIDEIQLCRRQVWRHRSQTSANADGHGPHASMDGLSTGNWSCGRVRCESFPARTKSTLMLSSCCCCPPSPQRRSNVGEMSWAYNWAAATPFQTSGE